MSNNSAPPAAPLRVRELSAETRQKIAAAVKQLWQNPEYRAKRATSLSQLRHDPEFRERQSAAAKRLWQNPEYRAKQQAASIRLWQDPEFRAKQKAALMAREISTETRGKLAAAGRRLWQDPDYRARQMAALIRGREISRENGRKMAESDQAKVEARQARLLSRNPVVTGDARGTSIVYNRYLKSGVWQCPQSPSGAHHWIINDGRMRCKHCQQERVVEQ